MNRIPWSSQGVALVQPRECLGPAKALAMSRGVIALYVGWMIPPLMVACTQFIPI